MGGPYNPNVDYSNRETAMADTKPKVICWIDGDNTVLHKRHFAERMDLNKTIRELMEEVVGAEYISISED